MYPSQGTFHWNLKQENVFIGSIKKWFSWQVRARVNTCFENLREDVDVGHSETLRMLNKKLTRFPQSLSFETKGSASRVQFVWPFTWNLPSTTEPTRDRGPNWYSFRDHQGTETSHHFKAQRLGNGVNRLPVKRPQNTVVRRKDCQNFHRQP